MAVQTKMTAQEFFQLPESMTLMELIDGELIVAPSPVPKHQLISAHLYDTIKALASGGTIMYAPTDVYLTETDVVQPDLLWIAPDGVCKVEEKYLSGAPDLVVEILSPATALRDKSTKFQLYEKFGVREYWIIDPSGQYIEVWTLADGKFARHGVYGSSDHFTSAVLDGQSVAAAAIFSA